MRTPLATLELAAAAVELRRAELDDLPALVELFAADPLWAALGKLPSTRRRTLSPTGGPSRRFDADPAQLLMVAEHGDEIVGTLQPTSRA